MTIFSSLDSNNNSLKLTPAQCSLDIVHSVRNLCFIFHERLTFKINRCDTPIARDSLAHLGLT